MKATTVILAVIFALQINILYAGTDGTVIKSPCAVTNLNITSGSSSIDLTSDACYLASLAPALPTEADFSDFAPALTIEISDLAPVTPAEADFNDTVGIPIRIKTLAPVTPAVADFE